MMRSVSSSAAAACGADHQTLVELMNDHELMQLVADELQDFETLQATRWTIRIPSHETGGQDNSSNNEHTDNSSSNSNSSSNPQRRRPRVELVRLHQEAKQLEAKLDQLRRNSLSVFLQQQGPSWIAPPSRITRPWNSSAPPPMRLRATATVDERFSQWIAQATAQWNRWKQLAQQQRLQRQHAEQVNHQLRRIMKRQVEMAHKMQSMVQKHTTGVQKRLASWMRDFVAANPSLSITAASTCAPATSISCSADEVPPPLKRRRTSDWNCSSPRHCTAPTPWRSTTGQATHHSTRRLQNCAGDQDTLHFLLQRAELSFQHMDLVFQQQMTFANPLQREPGDPNLNRTTNGVQLPRELTLRVHEQLNDVSLHDDFAEMNCCTVAQLDRQTLLDLFWKFFMDAPPKKKTNSHRGNHRDPHFNECASNCPTAVINLQVASSNASNSNSIFEAYEKNVVDDVIHAKGHFSIVLCQTRVQVEAQIALKKYSNVLVWESMGRMEPEPDDNNLCSNQYGTDGNYHRNPNIKSTFEFARSAWCRVESIAKDRSRLHLVSRMRPTSFESSSSVPASGRQSQEAKQQLHQQLELLAELMKRCQAEISAHLQQLLVEKRPQMTHN